MTGCFKGSPHESVEEQQRLGPAAEGLPLSEGGRPAAAPPNTAAQAAVDAVPSRVTLKGGGWGQTRDP